MSGTEHGQHAVVTGGAGDIGTAVCRRLLTDGYRVTVLDVAGAGERLRESLGSAAWQYRDVDVSDSQAVAEVFAELVDVDVLVCAAGIVRSAPFLQVSARDWQAQLDVNLTGCFLPAQAAARHMASRSVADGGPGGRIVMISSWVGEQPWPDISAYSVSKAGVLMLVRSMAAELAPFGIRVNALSPGIVAAGMARRQLETEPEYAARAATAVPLGRLQTAEEVADGVGFLCSDAARYMTGTSLVMDGGCSLRVVNGG
jgi:NAD(P)-dependent dehydrogenase (short-subunit alcohol dehydrogenase family)